MCLMVLSEEPEGSPARLLHSAPHRHTITIRPSIGQSCKNYLWMLLFVYHFVVHWSSHYIVLFFCSDSFVIQFGWFEMGWMLFTNVFHIQAIPGTKLFRVSALFTDAPANIVILRCSQCLPLSPTRGRHLIMLTKRAWRALFWRASYLGNKMILQPAAYASNLPSSQTEAILTVGWCKHFTLWVPATSLYRVFGSGRHLFCPT